MSAETLQKEKSTSEPTRFTSGQILTYHLVGYALRLFFKLYGRWRVIGLKENVPRTGPILLCGNHASNLDPVLGWAAFHGYRRLRGVAKIELWNNKISSYVLNAFESIPVKRHTADRAMFRTVLEGLERGDAIGIYPEGTRTYDGLLNPAQPGIGLLVQKSGLPVVPVANLGTFTMWPRGSKKFKRTRISIIFGKPLTFAPEMSREQIAERIMCAIADLMTANGVPTAPPGPERAALLADREREEERGKREENT